MLTILNYLWRGRQRNRVREEVYVVEKNVFVAQDDALKSTVADFQVTSSFANLPMPVIQNIMSYIPPCQQRGLRRSCRFFYQLSTQMTKGYYGPSNPTFNVAFYSGSMALNNEPPLLAICFVTMSDIWELFKVLRMSSDARKDYNMDSPHPVIDNGDAKTVKEEEKSLPLCQIKRPSPGRGSCCNEYIDARVFVSSNPNLPAIKYAIYKSRYIEARNFIYLGATKEYRFDPRHSYWQGERNSELPNEPNVYSFEDISSAHIAVFFINDLEPLRKDCGIYMLERIYAGFTGENPNVFVVIACADPDPKIKSLFQQHYIDILKSDPQKYPRLLCCYARSITELMNFIQQNTCFAQNYNPTAPSPLK